MVIVVCPLMHDKIIEIVEGIPNGNYKFIKKEGINLYFEIGSMLDEDAAKIIKSALK